MKSGAEAKPGARHSRSRAEERNRSRLFFSLREATFRLGDRVVFPNTTWSFGIDEHWAILGANASGKSLLADGIRGRLPLVQGELVYHFRPPEGLSQEEAIGHVAFEERKREMHGTVVQSRWNSLEEAETLRVRDFLAYERVMEVNPFEVTGRHEKERREFVRRRRRAVELLRLGLLLDRTLLSLSNGERQRAELARALCRPMRLLILDDPFAGLDWGMRAHLHNVLARLMAAPLRVLLLATRLEDLPREITHVLRVDNCRVVQAGRKEEMLLESKACQPPGRESRSKGLRPRPTPRANEFERAHSEVIRLSHVTVCYGRATILRDITWSVRAGESWALLGPNGSGKTTLLSLLLGDNPQVYRNEVMVFGCRRGEGESIWDLKTRIGWVSPELHVHFDDAITCFAAVGSGFHDSIGLFEPLSRRQRAAVRRWLRRFDLSGFARTPLFALSVGLQRAALLARALVKEPALLVLDEPCQGLDAKHREKFVATVDALIRKRSVTAIYVTHRPDEIPPSIQRVLRLDRGQARVERRR